MASFVKKHAYKPIKAVIEHVRDGSTIRAFLLPDFYHVTVMITGIRVSSNEFEIQYCCECQFVVNISNKY